MSKITSLSGMILVKRLPPFLYVNKTSYHKTERGIIINLEEVMTSENIPQYILCFVILNVFKSVLMADQMPKPFTRVLRISTPQQSGTIAMFNIISSNARKDFNEIQIKGS